MYGDDYWNIEIWWWKKNIILIFIKVNVNSKLVWGFVVMNLVGFVCVNYMVCCKVLFLFV